MGISLLREIVALFCLSIVVIYGCHKIKIPPILGFLLTGVVCGPYGLGLVKAVEQVETMADIGIVLLLFSIGLEHVSVAELIRLKKPVFIGGSVQVFLTVLVFGVVVYFAGSSLGLHLSGSIGPAIFAGCIISLSSTAIVLSNLQQKAQVDTPYGRIILSVLLYQDLIVVPMMLAVPFLAGHAPVFGWDVVIAAGSIILILGSSFLLARKIVPWVMRAVVHTKIRELFLISTLGICFAIAYFTSLLGLSLSLGAFLAGIILAESEYSHSALEGIMPFKDVFTSIFFISVGMLLNTSYFITHIGTVGLLTAAVLSIKVICASGVGAVLGYPMRIAVIVGMGLCQVGEFSFVLAKAGLDAAMFDNDTYQLFLAAIILTMAVTPSLLGVAPFVARKIAVFIHRDDAEENEDDSSKDADTALRDHLIIIGFGVGGRHLARAARMAGIGYNILEMNPDTVRSFSAKGEPIYHGDATHPAVLEHLGIRRARVLAVVISDPTATRGITEVAANLNPAVHILVRTRFLGEVAYLKALGAVDVVPEEFETSIEIFTRVLTRYLVPRNDIEHFTNEIRSENYDSLRDREANGTLLGVLQDQIPDLSVNALKIEHGSPLDGASLQDSNLRQRASMTVVAVKSGPEVISNPGGDFRFKAGDVAYVFSKGTDASAAIDLFSTPSDYFEHIEDDGFACVLLPNHKTLKGRENMGEE